MLRKDIKRVKRDFLWAAMIGAILLIELSLGINLPGAVVPGEAATMIKEMLPGNRHRIEFECGFMKPRFVKSRGYDRIEGMKLPNFGAPGMPKLPFRTVKILLPRGEVEYTVDVIPTQKKVVSGFFKMEPGQMPVPYMSTDYCIQKPHRKIERTPPDQKVYSSYEPYPGNIWSEVGVQYFRGFPILIINLYPVQYIPKVGTIFYYENMKVILTTTPSKHDPGLYRGKIKDMATLAAFIDTPEVLSIYPADPLSATYPPDATALLGSTDPYAAAAPLIEADPLLTTDPLLAAAPLSAEILSPLSSLIDPSLSYDYVIITSEYLRSATGAYTFQTLADHKNARGISTKIVTVEEIMNEPAYEDPNPLFNDTQARIRNFIRDAYLNWGTEYVLLGGDGDGAIASGETEDPIIPPRGFYVNSGSGYEDDFIPSDMYYGCLDGTFNSDEDELWGEPTDGPNGGEVDLFAEVYVGRAPVDSPIELENFVRKTLNYDNYPGLYLENVWMVGEYIGFGGVSDYGGNSKDQVINGSSDDGYTTMGIPDSLYTISTLYDRDTSSWLPSELISIVNGNIHVINHLGHASQDKVMKLSIAEVDALANNQYFFGYSQGCYAGAFDNRDVGKPFNTDPGYLTYDSVVEHLTVSADGGAFAFIANSRFGWGAHSSTDAPSQRFDREFFDAIYGEGIRHIGKANQDSKEDNIGLIDDPLIRWNYYQLNLFGDPEVSIKDPEMPDRDIAVVGIDVPKQMRPGTTTEISAGIMNQGIYDETDVMVDFMVDGIVLDSITIPHISSRSTERVNFIWSSEVEGIFVAAIQAGFVPEEDISTNNEQHASIWVRIPPPILIIDDDHGLETEDWYTDALDNNNYLYDYFVVRNQAGPDLRTLMLYDSIIWFVGNDYGIPGYWTLTPADRENIGDYLDAGGRLFLSGGKIGYDAKTFGWLEWYNTYLHANLVFVYSEGLQIFNGVPGDPISEGLTLMIGNPGGDGNQDLEAKASLNLPLSPGTSSFRSGGYDVGIATDTGIYKVLYLGFDFAAVDSAGAGKRDTLMGRVMEWLLESSQDEIPPMIFNVAVNSITSSSSQITWETDEGSDSVIKYGTTMALGSIVSDAAMVTGHSLTLSNLVSDKTYYFEVWSSDRNGNTTIDNNGGAYYAFTTLAGVTLPVISNVEISSITSSSASIAWLTDKLSDSQVDYGMDMTLGDAVFDSAIVSSHSIDLSDLVPETTYYFEVRSTDPSGNTAVDDNNGAYYTFTTAATSGGGGEGEETQTWTGAMMYSGQADNYYINVTAPGTIIADLTWNLLPINILDIYLINPDGLMEEVAQGSAGVAHIEYATTITGTWKIMVYGSQIIIRPQNYALTATYPVVSD